MAMLFQRVRTTGRYARGHSAHSHCSFPNSKNRTRKGSGWPSAIRCLPQTVLELPQQYSCPIAILLLRFSADRSQTLSRSCAAYNEIRHVLVCAAVVRPGVPGHLILARCRDYGLDASRIAVVPAPIPVLGRFQNDRSEPKPPALTTSQSARTGPTSS